MQPTQAFVIDGAKVRERCAADPGFGYELTRRFLVLVANRLQATRSRLLELDAHPADWP
jgi:CRP-like cAMP-binding protein